MIRNKYELKIILFLELSIASTLTGFSVLQDNSSTKTFLVNLTVATPVNH